MTTKKQTKTNAEYGFKVGDVFVSTWGYDQTNADFYKVTRVMPRKLELVPVGKVRTVCRDKDGNVIRNSTYGYCLPAPGAVSPNARPIVRLVKDYRMGGVERPHVDLNGYSSAYPWDGKPVMYSVLGH